MKITCNRNELTKAINVVMKAISSKSTLPLLKCVLFDAKNNNLTLVGNDGELGIETKINCNVQEEGKIAIDGKLLFGMIKNIPGEELKIENDNNFIMTLTSENLKYKIQCYDGVDFLSIADIDRENNLKVSQLNLKNAINKTIFSIAQNNNDIKLTGELFRIKDNKIYIRSIDGNRISQVVIDYESKEELSAELIIPGKSLQELSKILEDEEETKVDIYYLSKYCMFEFNNTRVITRLIEGKYYDVEKALNIGIEITVKIDRKELLNSLERSMLLVAEEKKPITLNIFDKNMILSINTSVGSMDEEINIEKDGNDLIISLNPKFLIDSLKAIDDDEINIYLTNNKSPVVIKNEEESYIYLIMPINMN